MIIIDFFEFIFGSALFINSLLFIPQAVKIFKEKTSQGVSLITFFGFLLIQFAIVIHGIITKDFVLAIGYLLSMLTCGTVVVLCLIYKSKYSYANERTISLSEVISQLPEHVYWKNLEGEMLGCNTNNWKDFGLKSLDDILGKRDSDLFLKHQADIIRQTDLNVIQNGQPIIMEEGVTINEKTTLYLSHKVPLRNRYGQIIGVIGVSVDITDVKKQEVERLEFLENIIAVMPGTVYWMNREGVYLGCNDNEAKAIGLASRKDIVGKRNVDIPGFLIPEVLDPVNQKVMESGQAILLEEPARLQNGTEAIFLSNKAPIRNATGEVVGMVGISMDITNQRKAEKALIDTQNKLEGMTIVSASIAHELRTPLSSLNLSISNIKDVLPDLIHAYKLSKEAKLNVKDIRDNYLGFLENQLSSMHTEIVASFTFIDMLLLNLNPTYDLSKIEMFSANRCIEEALLRYPFTQGQKNILFWKKNEAADFIIRGEFLLVIHVIFNLLKNALYYIAKAGKGEITIWTECTKPYSKIYFKDTGAGISEKILPFIFDRFFSKTYHGAGVGLTFCRWVMENLGGTISCESIENEYTLFILSFPKAEQQVEFLNKDGNLYESIDVKYL